MDQHHQTRVLSEKDFAAPPEDRYFEDYEAGAVYEYGYVTVDEDEVVGFAEHYDRQAIHTDKQWAAAGPFGGLIASGWHTGALTMRMFADHFLSRVASLSSPGLDELRWLAPVRPGDTLRVKVTIVEARRSRSKPDRGIVRTHTEAFNQDDVCVLSMDAANLIAARPG